MECWIDGAKRPKTWTERLDRAWRRVWRPKSLASVAIVAPTGRLTIDVPDDPGIRYVLDEVLTHDCYCYPTVPGIEGIATIVDVGANVGIAAARVRLAYREARIFCFEPNTAALPHLQANAARIGAEVHPVGLGAVDAELPLYQGAQSTVTASLHAHSMSTANPLGSVRILRADTALGEAGVASIDILKIETEGSELPILGALSSLLAAVKIVYLEFHSEPDRRAIETLLAPTHLLWSGNVAAGHTGQSCYVRRDLAPKVHGIGA